MKTRFVAFVTATMLIAGTLSEALAAPPSSSTNHQATHVSLRDAVDDILLSDGIPTYAGNDALSTKITDFSDPTTADRFQFQPWRKRRVRIHSSYIDNGLPVRCEFSYIVFSSSTTPNWYELLSSGAQSSVLSDASFLCHDADQRRWAVRYPDGAEECAVIERLDPSTWRFSVPAYVVDPVFGTATGCPATLTTEIKERGQTSVTEQAGVSAPMEITATIP